MKDNKDRDEVLAAVKEDGGVENKLKNQLLEQKIIKISIYLRDIGEIETMTATYFFEDGTEKKKEILITIILWMETFIFLMLRT